MKDSLNDDKRVMLLDKCTESNNYLKHRVVACIFLKIKILETT